MAESRSARVIALISAVMAALATARLADAFGKRELGRVAAEVSRERVEAERQHRAAADERENLEQDKLLLEQRIGFMRKAEHYLIIDRGRRLLQLVQGDKVMLEARFVLRGPLDGITGFRALPRAKLEVLGKRLSTDWYRPDWLYSYEGVPPPSNTAARIVEDAFGPGELFLGGGIAIHGRVRGAMPPEAVNHTYLELDDRALEAVANAIEPGSLVFIE